MLQAEYCNADHTTWKLTLQDINTTPKEPKTARDCSLSSCFAIIVAHQYGVTTEQLCWKITRTRWFKLRPETPTPIESRHITSPGRQDSKFQVDVSQRKCRKKDWPKSTSVAVFVVIVRTTRECGLTTSFPVGERTWERGWWLKSLMSGFATTQAHRFGAGNSFIA